MARLRFFAGLREAAGTGSAEIEAGSVGDVLAQAVERYGPDFERRLATARIWVNGDPATASTPVSGGDEIAIIPPVSGGGLVTEGETEVTPVLPVLPWMAWAAVLVANLASPEWLAVAAVGVVGLWVWDVFDEAADRGAGMVRWPALAGAFGAAVAAWRWGSEGFGMAVGLTVIATLSWAVFFKRHRTLDGLGGSVLAATAGAAATGAAVLVRAGAEGEDRITAFLIMIAVANIVLWVMSRSEPGGFLDPHTSASIGVLITGLITGIVFDTALVAMVLAAAAVAASFLAGRAFGSALRTGDLYLLQRLPGMLAPVDGAMLAMPVYWVILAAVA